MNELFLIMILFPKSNKNNVLSMLLTVFINFEFSILIKFLSYAYNIEDYYYINAFIKEMLLTVKTLP